MSFTEVSTDILGQFAGIVGPVNTIVDPGKRFNYSSDETEDHSFLPDVVLKPGTAEEISQIMKLCNAHGIPVTPRGGGTGLSGGALPVHKGVVISMERFNKILHIDELNLQATVEPGVITQVFQNAVKEKKIVLSSRSGQPGKLFYWRQCIGEQRRPKGCEVRRNP